MFKSNYLKQNSFSMVTPDLSDIFHNGLDNGYSSEIELTRIETIMPVCDTISRNEWLTSQGLSPELLTPDMIHNSLNSGLSSIYTIVPMSFVSIVSMIVLALI